MNKTKILAFIALAAMLSACGSDEGSPPELANSPSSISPFDTLVVKFKSELVDLDKLDESNITLNQGKRIEGKATGKELRFIGTNTTPGGLNYFDMGVNDSIEFKKLKNSDGYIKDRTVFYFSTHRTLDLEPNNDSTDAGSINSLGDMTKGVVFVGVLDKKIGAATQGTIYDTEDFYKLDSLKNGDIIIITASNKTTPFKVRFYGPCNPVKICNDKTDSTSTAKKFITLMDTIKTGHLQGSDPLDKEATFFINVSDDDTKTKSNPYTITVLKK